MIRLITDGIEVICFPLERPIEDVTAKPTSEVWMHPVLNGTARDYFE